MQCPIQNKAELLARIEQNSERILRYGVKQLGIFGSFAKDKVTTGSDVDFFVEFEPEQKTFDNFMDLAELLEEITGRNVELITPQSLSKHIGKYILKEVEYVALAA